MAKQKKSTTSQEYMPTAEEVQAVAKYAAIAPKPADWVELTIPKGSTVFARPAGYRRLLLTSDMPGLGGLPYTRLSGGILRAPGVVSRKKQLLPAFLSALEG